MLHDFESSNCISLDKYYIYRSISTGVGSRKTCMVPALLHIIASVSVSSDGSTRCPSVFSLSAKNCRFRVRNNWRLLLPKDDIVTIYNGMLIFAG